MSKGTFGGTENDVANEQLPPVTEREVKEVFVSDGVYKYIYVDTGEDVV